MKMIKHLALAATLLTLLVSSAYAETCGEGQFMRNGICWRRVIVNAANTVKMPKELRGVWCAKNAMTKKQIFIRCREADGEDHVAVNAHEFFPREETVCTPLAITPNNSGFLVQAHCDGQGDGPWNGRVLNQWRLFKYGRRLETRMIKHLATLAALICISQNLNLTEVSCPKRRITNRGGR
jgi:hypothetical protein